MTRLLGDRYELRQRLWTGALTEAHEAMDLKRGERVVVELLRPGAAQESQNVALFKLALRTAAGLNHPRIEHVSSAEEIEGYHLVTRELLRGRTLRQTVEATGALDPERALAIAVDAGEALAHAHRSGSAHGALTPDAIHIGPTGHVMLTGFGLTARSTDGLNPQFAAPERRSLRQANPSCDIYALGRCLQFMLTGEAPGQDPADQPAPTLDQPELEFVLRRMLAHDPHERQVTMAAVTDDLRRCQEMERKPAAAAIRPDAVIPPPSRPRPSSRRSAAAADGGRAGAHASEPEGGRHWRRRLLIAAACSLLVGGGWVALVGDSADSRTPTGDQAQADVMTEADELGGPAPSEAGQNSPSTTAPGTSTTTRADNSTPPASAPTRFDGPGTTAPVAGDSGGGPASGELPESGSLRPSAPSGSLGSGSSTPTSTTATTSSTPTTQQRIAVPDVVGMTEQGAVDTLAASRLEAQVTDDCLLCVLGCQVAEQDPQAETQVVVGSTVDLTIRCL